LSEKKKRKEGRKEGRKKERIKEEETKESQNVTTDQERGSCRRKFSLAVSGTTTRTHLG
jgi:hypothetical protein